MMKAISFKICPFVQRVTALLEAKNMPYEIEYINLRDKPQWFLDMSPNGQVPVLVTDSGITLFESDAICEYLDEVGRPIEYNTTPEQRAIDRAWSYMATKNYLVQCGAMRSADQDTLTKRSEKLSKVFTKANSVLGEGPFFKGESFSNVDIAWLPLLHRANLILEHTGYDFLTDCPKVKKWQTAIMKTGIVEKSVSDDFENRFTDFYLSDETYLGAGKSYINASGAKCANARCC